MSLPHSIAEIIELTEPYMIKAAGSRPQYEKTLADGVEIEIKIPIYAKEDVTVIMETLLTHGLTGAEHRSEEHYVYLLDGGAHLNRLLIKETGEVWLKTKSKNKPIFTPHYKLPAVCRSGKKLKSGDADYQKAYKMTTTLPLATHFEKECLNFFYLYRQCVFSLSFSLAWNKNGFLRREMEFEYEGHTSQKEAPSRQDVKEILENMMVDIVPANLRSKAHSETKFESLSAMGAVTKSKIRL